MLRTTRRRLNLRVQSGSKVDDRDEIELKILAWLEKPDAKLKPTMDLVGLEDGSFGSSRKAIDGRTLHSRRSNPTQQPPPQKEPKNGKH